MELSGISRFIVTLPKTKKGKEEGMARGSDQAIDPTKIRSRRNSLKTLSAARPSLLSTSRLRITLDSIRVVAPLSQRRSLDSDA